MTPIRLLFVSNADSKSAWKQRLVALDLRTGEPRRALPASCKDSRVRCKIYPEPAV